MIFKDTFEDLTPERSREIIDSFEAGKGAEVVPGPQIDRIYSAPIAGLTTLQAPVEEKKKSSAKSKDEQAVSCLRRMRQSLRPRRRYQSDLEDAGHRQEGGGEERQGRGRNGR